MKFLHTADWHIGRILNNVSLLEDQRHALDQILTYIEDKSVDVLIIAGDIYDRSVPPASSVELLDEVLSKVCLDLSVSVVMIPGNHDGAQRLSFGSRQLSQAGLHIIGNLDQITEPVIIGASEDQIHFYGIPYFDPQTVRNHFGAQVSTFDEANTYLIEMIKENMSSEANNVLIGHCFLEGGEASESERPLSIGGADQVSHKGFMAFDYVALGHLHRPQFKGEDYIRYSGSIVKYSFSEQHHDKGVTLVEMDGNGLKNIEHLQLTPLRDMRIIEGEFRQILEQGKVDPNSNDYLAVRLTDRHAILDPMSQLRDVYPNVLLRISVAPYVDS